MNLALSASKVRFTSFVYLSELGFPFKKHSVWHGHRAEIMDESAVEVSKPQKLL